MILDFIFFVILVKTPDNGSSGNEIQLEIPNDGTSRTAQEDQPTYQGLLNENSEFIYDISLCVSYNWFAIILARPKKYNYKKYIDICILSLF